MVRTILNSDAERRKQTKSLHHCILVQQGALQTTVLVHHQHSATQSAGQENKHHYFLTTTLQTQNCPALVYTMVHTEATPASRHGRVATVLTGALCIYGEHGTSVYTTVRHRADCKTFCSSPKQHYTWRLEFTKAKSGSR